VNECTQVLDFKGLFPYPRGLWITLWETYADAR
jgi:hypothetical protein